MPSQQEIKQFRLIESFVKGIISAEEFIKRYSEIDEIDPDKDDEKSYLNEIFNSVEESIACYEPNELKWKESMNYLNERQFAVKLRWAYERLKKIFQ